MTIRRTKKIHRRGSNPTALLLVQHGRNALLASDDRPQTTDDRRKPALPSSVVGRRSSKPSRDFRRTVLVWGIGAIEALLLARLIARLLAARPTSPSVQILYGITGPFVTPLRALDYNQPPFGAALELSTLTLALILPIVAYLLWALLVARNSTPPADV